MFDYPRVRSFLKNWMGYDGIRKKICGSIFIYWYCKFLVAKARCMTSDCWSWGFRLGTSWLVSQQLWLWSLGLLHSEWPKACGWKGFAIFCIDHPSFWAPKVNLRSIYHLCCFKAAAVPLSAVALLFEPHVLECADSVWPGWQMKCGFHCSRLLPRAPAQGLRSLWCSTGDVDSSISKPGPRIDWSTGDSQIPGHHPQENRGKSFIIWVASYKSPNINQSHFLCQGLAAGSCMWFLGRHLSGKAEQNTGGFYPQLHWGLVARGQRSHEALKICQAVGICWNMLEPGITHS